MRCPCCGSPVMIRGDRWECGYCGDAGFLNPPSETELDFTLTIEYTIDYCLSDIWNLMTSCLRNLIPNQANSLTESLKKAVIYEISAGFSKNPRVLPGEKEKQLQDFLSQNLPGLPTAGQILREARQGKLFFGSVGRLTPDFCGSFYRELIESEIEEDSLEFLMDILIGLHRFHVIFRTDRYDEHFLDFMCTHEFPESDRQYELFLKFYKQLHSAAF